LRSWVSGIIADGVRVADDWDDLALNGPIEGIIVTDTGDVIFDKRVWTSTAPSGKVLDPAAHCQSWTNSAPAEKSRVGNSGDENSQTKENYVWTGSLPDGQPALGSEFCGEWLETMGFLIFGGEGRSLETDGKWSFFDQGDCG